jgi:hypothetical protein
LATRSDEVRTPEVALDVLALIQDAEADLETRCRAAYTLGLLRTRNAPAHFGEDAARALANLTFDVCQKMGFDRPEPGPDEPQAAKSVEDPRHYFAAEPQPKGSGSPPVSRIDSPLR